MPQVERRDVHKPKYPSNDFEIGLFGGTYSSQNFGTSFNWGARLGYDITEDFFVEATYGRTKVSDKAFRQILPGGIFTAEQEKLKYYDLSVGWNFLPGEIFIGKNWAKASTMYAIGGIGNTSFDSQRMQTWNFGAGRQAVPGRLGRAAGRRPRPHLHARPARQALHHAEPGAVARLRVLLLTKLTPIRLDRTARVVDIPDDTPSPPFVSSQVTPHAHDPLSSPPPLSPPSRWASPRPTRRPTR